MTFNVREIHYIFDDPVPYKELKFYPVRMKDYMTFAMLSSCLLLEKNSVPDVNVIQMTYLEYMISISNDENKLLHLFVGLMGLVLNRKEAEFEIRFGKDDKDKAIFQIDNIIYNSSDFDEIRKLIAEQNMLDLPDETIQKNIRDKMEEARKFREKVTGNKMASLEDQIIAVALYSGWDLDKIYMMTVRKFLKAVQRANHMIYSNIYTTASMSGFVEFKDKSVIKSWLADISDDNQKETIPVEDVENKINFNSAK